MITSFLDTSCLNIVIKLRYDAASFIHPRICLSFPHDHNSDVLCSVVGNRFFSLAVIVSFIYLPQGLLLYDNF